MKPTDEEISTWHRYFGSRANNRAWQLSESDQRTAQESEEMVHAAHAALFHWQAVGNANHRAHAEQLLAHVYALCANGAEARKYFDSAQAVFSGPDAQPWEVAIHCAIAAHVAAACGQSAEHHAQYQTGRDRTLLMKFEQADRL